MLPTTNSLKLLRCSLLFFYAACAAGQAQASSVVIDFAELDFATAPTGPAEAYGTGGEVYVNGMHLDGSFSSKGVRFDNEYIHEWESWFGFAYSNTSDTTTAAFSNQYSAITGSGVNGSSAYGIYSHSFYADNRIHLSPAFNRPQSVYLTNTTYAYFSMLYGDSFAKKFGGVSGEDPDWLLVQITGYDTENTVTASIDFYLADFRSADPAQHYILDEWVQVDLSALGEVSSIGFVLSSSDSGAFGMNTPAYFAFDQLVIVPEPATYAGLLSMFVLLALLRRKRND